MVYDRAGCIDVAKQDADPKVVTSPVVKHAVLYPHRDQLMNVELPDLTYDVCVLTGDYRGATFGPFDAALDGLARVSSHLKEPVYGVLGNHDTIRMVPGLEEMGIRMLLNECERILRGDQAIYLAGIDDDDADVVVSRIFRVAPGRVR